MNKETKYIFTAIRADYLTPPEVYQPFLDKIGRDKFDLDVCCTLKNIPAVKHFIHGLFNGLLEEWEEYNWLNPPFKYTEKWVNKAVCEQKKGRTTFSILPVHTEAKYWKECILENPYAEVVWLTKNKKEGVSFWLPETMDYVRTESGEKGLYKNPLALVTFHGIKPNDNRIFNNINSLKKELERVTKIKCKFKQIIESMLIKRTCD